jgi:tetratricopeptide (TPR) repeat protein
MFISLVELKVSMAERFEEGVSYLQNGEMLAAYKVLREVYDNSPGDMSVGRNYIKVLYNLGEYPTIIGKFGSTSDEYIRQIVEKSKKNMKMIQGNYFDHIDYLVRESPYSKRILIDGMSKAVKMKDYERALGYLTKALGIYPRDREILEAGARLHCIRGEYEEGIATFDAIGKHDVADTFGSVIEEYQMVRRTADDAGRFKGYDGLLKSIDIYMLYDSYVPSIYTHIKHKVLRECCILGINTGYSGLSFRTKQLLDLSPNDEAKYMYIMSMIHDNNVDEAELEFKKMTFSNKEYENALRMSFDRGRKAKAEEEERRRKKEEGNKREYGQYRNSRRGSGSDPKGYYKTLGVKPDADKKEIKKRYLKLVRENNPDEFDDPKEKKRRSKIMMDVNEAKSVLLDDEKRKKYDSGIGEDAQGYAGEGFNFGGNGFQDVFEAFFGGGGGYYGSRPNSGQRTYYYFRRG